MARHFRNIVVVSLSTVGSRVLGLARDVLLFAFLGASAINSAFIFAFTLPNLFRRLLGEGALSSAVVPVFSSEYEGNGKEAAFRFLNQALTWVLVLLISLVILGSVTLFGIGYWDGLEERWYLGFELGIIMFPYMIFVCLAAIIAAALNVFERFAVGALSQVWLNLSMIFFLGVLGALFGKTPMAQVYYLCAGVLVGGLLQVIIPVRTLILMGWRPKIDFEMSGSILELGKLVIPGLAGAVIFQVNSVVSQLLAFSLNDKSVSILYLANRLIEFPLGVFTIAVTTVLFPTIARLAAQRNMGELGREYKRGLRIIFAITIPSMMGLIVLHESILGLLFEWGRFDAKDVNLTAPILIIFSMALPFYSLSTFATRGFHALKDMKTPYRLAVYIFILNVVLSLTLMFPFGIVGLAGANVISAIVNAIVLQWLLERKERNFGHAGLGRELLKIVFSAGFMGVVAWGIRGVVVFYLGGGKVGDMLTVVLGIPVCVGIYFYILKLLRFEELDEIIKFFRKA
jgi:putative peptidoglycan lipid II flippase